MAHGYLGDGYGSHGEIDPDSDRDRDRDRDRDWRERGEHWRDRDRDRDRGMMFGRGERSDEDRWSGRSESRPREFGYGSYSEDRRSFSAHPDDHYRSWLDRHMSELDRDYQDYCRDREQQFHREFDDWRQRRYGNPQPLRTGMTQTGMSHDPSGELQLTNESSVGATEPDPTTEATLGTNSARGTRSGRNRG
jgi:hypothetical protein